MTEVLSTPSQFDGHYRPSRRSAHHNVSPPTSPSSIPRTYQRTPTKFDAYEPTYIAQPTAIKSQNSTLITKVPVPQVERSQFLFCDYGDEEDDLDFPVYDYAETITPNASPDLEPSPSAYSSASGTSTSSTSSSSTVSPPNTPEPEQPISVALDDTTIRHEPSRHVDYLSHNWKEEDIWASWRYMIGKRNYYQNSARLENASWRTWAKAKNNLKTLSPEKLNW